MTKLQDLKPGDEAWILNGARNRAFPAVIIAIIRAGSTAKILARNVAKDEARNFELTGESIADAGHVWKEAPPILVPADDERALAIAGRSEHSKLHEAVRNAAVVYARDATQFNYLLLLSACARWDQHSTGKYLEGQNIETEIRRAQA